MSNVWFTSDLHLFHAPMAFLRRHGRWPDDHDWMSLKYDEEYVARLNAWHNDLITDNWWGLVKDADHVWVVGDVTANNRFLEPALDVLDLLPGHKHLVPGNHDPLHPMHAMAHQWEHRYHRVFESISIARSRRFTNEDGSKGRLLISHFPYVGDGDGREDRGTQFRLRDEGIPLVHGHIHTKDRLTFTYTPPPTWGFSRLAKPKPRTPQVHVGLDAWEMAPVHLDEVTRLVHEGHREIQLANSRFTGRS